MRGYVKIKDGDKDKNNKLKSLHIDDDKPLEKYQAIWIEIEGLLGIKY